VYWDEKKAKGQNTARQTTLPGLGGNSIREPLDGIHGTTLNVKELMECKSPAPGLPNPPAGSSIN
jgi:hypothetical protein